MIGLRKKNENAQTQTPSSDGSTESNKLDVENKAEENRKSSGGRGRGRGAAFLGLRKNGAKNNGRKKLSPGELRIQKDISELDGGDCAVAEFPDPNNLMNFLVTVSPDEGYWKGYKYRFEFNIPDLYPHEPPKVKCLDKIYHPNIDPAGNVCLNILRTDWKPVLDVNAIIYGLIVLFVQPNGDDPLNLEAAKTLRENPKQFKNNVEKSLRGQSVDGERYPPAIKNK